MPDREKIIRDIERCAHHVPDACRDCSKYGGGYELRCMEHLMEDALALLREQDAVKPKWFLKDPFFRCGVCDKELPDSQFRFCPWCGRAVKWDAADRR